MYRDSVGNTYSHLPTKKPTKGAKAATNTSMRRSRKQGHRKDGADKHVHGIGTGLNGSPWYVHVFKHQGRRRAVNTKWGRAAGGLELPGEQ